MKQITLEEVSNLYKQKITCFFKDNLMKKYFKLTYNDDANGGAPGTYPGDDKRTWFVPTKVEKVFFEIYVDEKKNT